MYSLEDTFLESFFFVTKAFGMGWNLIRRVWFDSLQSFCDVRAGISDFYEALFDLKKVLNIEGARLIKREK